MSTLKTPIAFRLTVIASLGMLSVVVATPSLWAQTKGGKYSVVRLAVPGAATASTGVHDLNDNGNVVGTYRDSDGVQYGFHYEHAAKTYTSLGAGVAARGINQLNQLVGELVGTDETPNTGLYWSSPSDLAPTPLPPLGAHTHSRANAINDAGVIVGSSYIPEESPVTPNYRAIVVWRVDALGNVSGPIALPFPVDDLRGYAGDLTEQDDGGVTVIVGTTGDSTTLSSSAVQWSVIVDEGGTLSLLTGPTELAAGYGYPEALGINASLSVVGRAAFTAGGPGWAYLKPADSSSLVPLAGIPKATWGVARAINDAGKIVGYQSYLSHGPVSRAVLWTSPTTVVDLNYQVTLGRSETLTMASLINRRGDILASINSNIGCLLIAK